MNTHLSRLQQDLFHELKKVMLNMYRIYYVDAEDKPHNLRVDVVDPASTTDITSKLKSS